MKYFFAILFLFSIAHTKDLVTTLIESGNKKNESKNFQEAIADFSKAIKLDKQNIAAYMGRGSSEMGLERYASAIIDFSLVLLIEPGNAFAHHRRGLAYLQVFHKERARKDFEQAELNGSPVSQKIWDMCQSDETDKLLEATSPGNSSSGSSQQSQLTRGWKKVCSFSGSSIMSTDDFTINSDKWKIIWSARSIESGGSMFFSGYVKHLDDLVIFGNIQASNSGESVYRTKGTHHFDVNCFGCEWSIEVQEFN